MSSNAKYTVRVYALIVNDQNEILVSDESYSGLNFTKFPGGGMEWGEGTLNTLKRELLEEIDLRVETCEHFYTTDFFVPSFFDSTVQVISIYYKVNEGLSGDSIHNQSQDEHVKGFRWIPLKTLNQDQVTFPIDKHVVKLLTS